MYIYTCTYTHVHINVYIHMYIYMFIYMFIYKYIDLIKKNENFVVYIKGRTHSLTVLRTNLDQV